MRNDTLKTIQQRAEAATALTDSDATRYDNGGGRLAVFGDPSEQPVILAEFDNDADYDFYISARVSVLALCAEVRRLTRELAKRPTWERALAAAELALNDLYDDLEQELPEDPA